MTDDTIEAELAEKVLLYLTDDEGADLQLALGAALRAAVGIAATIGGPQARQTVHQAIDYGFDEMAAGNVRPVVKTRH